MRTPSSGLAEVSLCGRRRPRFCRQPGRLSPRKHHPAGRPGGGGPAQHQKTFQPQAVHFPYRRRRAALVFPIPSRAVCDHRPAGRCHDHQDLSRKVSVFFSGSKRSPRSAPRAGSLRGHGDDVVCLITDIFFPKGNELQSGAGRDLIRLVNKRFPRIPVIIASKAKEAHELQGLGFVLPKGDPGSLEKLKEYILNFTGMGDFLVSDDDGRELRRARNIREICGILLDAEKDTEEARRLRQILENYGEQGQVFDLALHAQLPGARGQAAPQEEPGPRAHYPSQEKPAGRNSAPGPDPARHGRGKNPSTCPISWRPFAPCRRRRFSPTLITTSSPPGSIARATPSWPRSSAPSTAAVLELLQTLVEIVEKWITVYRERGLSHLIFSHPAQR